MLKHKIQWTKSLTEVVQILTGKGRILESSKEDPVPVPETQASRATRTIPCSFDASCRPVTAHLARKDTLSNHLLL